MDAKSLIYDRPIIFPRIMCLIVNFISF